MPEQYKRDLMNLRSLTVFRPLADTPALRALADVWARLGGGAEPLLEAYGRLLFSVREAGFSDLGAYVADHLRHDDSAFGRAAAGGGADAEFIAAARRDAEILGAAAALDFGALRCAMAQAHPEERELFLSLPALGPGAPPDFGALLESFRLNGVGLFSRGRAFLWADGALLPVRNRDPISWEDMFGYTAQRGEVLRNTRLLLAGRPARNVLLYGDSGTGKSATVKSLVNVPEFSNLRIVEVSKSGLDTLTALTRLVGGHTQKFILYIDDLTFEHADRAYSALKTALEGGLETRPENAVIYATSNRRHLVRETFEDRQGGDVHREETIQERTSLSDRFGLRILYPSLGKLEFLDLVEQLAAREGLREDPAALRRGAMAWELRRGGRTPRAARQFVDSLHMGAGLPE